MPTAEHNSHFSPGCEPFLDTLTAAGESHRFINLKSALPEARLKTLPRSLKVLCENIVRKSPQSLPSLLTALNDPAQRLELPFFPGRVLMHDTTCLPALADIAGLRSSVAERGGDPTLINPTIPVDLVIDHSVTVEHYAEPNAAQRNLAIDFERNAERYRFVKWAQQSLRNFRVVPPGSGILHQINLEYLAEVVKLAPGPTAPLLFPDTLVGTDSHTPMINALGVLGWGVGGIEAQSAMLGEPISIVLPRVVGVRLTGHLRAGVTSTDLVLHLTKVFRDHGVVDKFIEFFGPGVATLLVGERATVSNMAPEYGSTCSYFPIDPHTIAYLRSTGRSAQHCERVEAYARAQGLWYSAGDTEPHCDEQIDVDLDQVAATMSGPRQPHQRQSLSNVWKSFVAEFGAPRNDERAGAYSDGTVALAAITSCTNTSNPRLMIGAGLLARNARQRGLTRKPWVKTSLSPGSKVVTDYLSVAGLQKDLDALGFNLVGYGCMTCIGNSGALQEDVALAVEKDALRAVGVISGNRNFDGRVNTQLAGVYLASPALVVACSIAGTVNCDLTRDPIGTAQDGSAVRLADIWPTDDEIDAVLAQCMQVDQFRKNYRDIWSGSEHWQALSASSSDIFPWEEKSDYIRRPPYVDPPRLDNVAVIANARCLLVLGDNVTTDHISPAGTIPLQSIAGKYLSAHGVQPADFNQYSTRRSNHEVMMRGAFSNSKLVNELAKDDNKRSGALAWSADRAHMLPAYEAALTYARETPLVIMAGKNYGAGSSRDWAAKAPALLGVRAVFAENYERIHRSNLIGLGIYPLEFADGFKRNDFCHDGRERFDIDLTGLQAGLNHVSVRVTDSQGKMRMLSVACRIDSIQELEYLKHRGVLPYIVQQTLSKKPLQI